MKKKQKLIVGRFTQPAVLDGEIVDSGKPVESGVLYLELNEPATVIETGEEVDTEEIKIQLDEDGRIPPDTRVWGNDQLHRPLRTSYHATVFCAVSGPCFDGCLQIVGKPPINLNALTLEDREPDPVYEPEPEPEYDLGPAPEPPRVAAPRKPGSTANHIGFFGITVTPPVNMGSTGVPSLDSRSFRVWAFQLPSEAAVGCVSIIVESPQLDNELIVGLYNAADRKRVLAQSIGIDKAGIATGTLKAPVHLPAGDYFLAYATRRSAPTARVRSIEINRDLLGLMIAGDGAIVGGVAKAAGHELPETLGDIAPMLGIPPLIFFKA